MKEKKSEFIKLILIRWKTLYVLIKTSSNYEKKVY